MKLSWRRNKRSNIDSDDLLPSCPYDPFPEEKKETKTAFSTASCHPLHQRRDINDLQRNIGSKSTHTLLRHVFTVEEETVLINPIFFRVMH